MTTGANNLATVTSSTTLTDMNLNQWYLMSDLITVNDADGDTIQGIRSSMDIIMVRGIPRSLFSKSA